MILNKILDRHDEMRDWGEQSIMFEMNMWVLIIIGGIFVLLISLWILTYVYKDAVKRDIPNPVVWLLIVLMFNILGLFLYLILRGSYSSNSSGGATPKPEENQVYKPVNSYKNGEVDIVPAADDLAKFCPMCGGKLRENALFCALCGNKI